MRLYFRINVYQNRSLFLRKYKNVVDMMIKYCQLNLKHHCRITFMLSWRYLFQQKFWYIFIKFIEDSMMWYMIYFSREFNIWVSIWIDDWNTSNAIYNLIYFLFINHTRYIQWYSFAICFNTWNKSYLKYKHKNQIKIDIQVIFLLKRYSFQLD